MLDRALDLACLPIPFNALEGTLFLLTLSTASSSSWTTMARSYTSPRRSSTDPLRDAPEQQPFVMWLSPHSPALLLLLQCVGGCQHCHLCPQPQAPPLFCQHTPLLLALNAPHAQAAAILEKKGKTILEGLLAVLVLGNKPTNHKTVTSHSF